MWSKQATDTRNKNMTSFKNKITNRKRKNGNTVTPTTTTTTTVPADNSNNDEISTNNTSLKNDNKKQQQLKKNQRSSSNKNHRGRTNLKNCNNKETKDEKNSNTKLIIINKDVDETTKTQQQPDVILRNSNNTTLVDQNNTNLKRYSDSYVIENNVLQQINDTKKQQNGQKLTRAVSGFFVIDNTKKNRRFSDIFRHTGSGVKNLSNSIENLQMDVKNATNDSYLKRVKSKIYKTTKNEQIDEPDSNCSTKIKKLKMKKNSIGIPEDEVAILTPPGLKKSSTHFDFRLIRQSSNLERISNNRQKTFGVCKAIDENHVVNNNGKDRPILEKSKSSSAINLSLLRARRNKVLNLNTNNCKSVENEFNFIAFSNNNLKNNVFGSEINLNMVKQHKNKGEVKTSQPVSRSGSDRRPDSVREENRHQDSPTGGGGGSSGDGLHDENYDKDELTAPDSTTNLPTSSNKRKPTNKINRSESVKEQSTDKSQRKRRHMSGRNISDPSHKNTSGDVDLEHQPGLSNTESGSSSSNVSINGRLSESPSNSFDVGRIIKSESESDMDGELDPLNWQDLVPEEELKNLNVYEKKRQDVINELFMTEGSHVRNLKVLYKIFYKQLLESQTLKTDELNLIFPNIKEMLDIHSEFNKKMRSRRKEDPVVRRCGDMLVEMFDGDCLQRAAATFCERQQLALEFIKDRRKRDNKFDGVLVECEKKRQCRRLQLQGIIPIEMQRLSKYPLLLERLINSVELINNMDDKHNNEDDELGKLRLAHKLSKDVLNYVNEATKLALNKQRLEDIQKHLDLQAFERFDHPIVKDYQNLDLTKFKLVLEGDMQFRRPNKAIVPVHILLLDEAVIILHRENDRYSLKFFQSGSQAQPQPFSPIIKMSTLLVRPNAVCKNGLFLFNTSTVSSQMYDLVVDDDAKRDSWFKHFTEAAENYKIAGKPKRPPTIEPNTETTVETDNNGVDNNVVNNESVSKNETSLIQQQQQESDKDMNSSTPEMISGGGVQTTRVTAEEWPLIQPSQVNVAIPPVHVAEAKLTLIEQIRRKDALIKNTLAEKERMVAELLNIPEEHYSHIVDMATTETTINKDISEQILSVNHQIGKLQLAVNESLNVSEKEAMLAKGGKIQSCTSQQNNDTVKPPSVSTYIVQEAVNLLSLQLTNLWSEMKQIEEERDRFRKELHNIRERFHEENNLHDHLPVNNSQEEDLSPTNDDNPDPETESASTEEQ